MKAYVEQKDNEENYKKDGKTIKWLGDNGRKLVSTEKHF